MQGLWIPVWDPSILSLHTMQWTAGVQLPPQKNPLSMDDYLFYIYSAVAPNAQPGWPSLYQMLYNHIVNDSPVPKENINICGSSRESTEDNGESRGP